MILKVHTIFFLFFFVFSFSFFTERSCFKGKTTTIVCALCTLDERIKKIQREDIKCSLRSSFFPHRKIRRQVKTFSLKLWRPVFWYFQDLHTSTWKLVYINLQLAVCLTSNDLLKNRFSETLRTNDLNFLSMPQFITCMSLLHGFSPCRLRIDDLFPRITVFLWNFFPLSTLSKVKALTYFGCFHCCVLVEFFTLTQHMKPGLRYFLGAMRCQVSCHFFHLPVK